MKLVMVDKSKSRKDGFCAKECPAAIMTNALKMSLKNLNRSMTSDSPASTASFVLRVLKKNFFARCVDLLSPD